MTTYRLPAAERSLDVEVAPGLEGAVPDGWRPFVASGGSAPRVRVERRLAAPTAGGLGFFAKSGRFTTRNFDVGRGEAGVVASVAPSAAVVAQAVRVAVEAELVAAGWWSWHASAVLVGGRGVVFSAVSGTGKSTLARHCEAAGLTRLSDEATLVSVGAAGARVSAHPCQLESARLGEVFPLGLACFLERGEPGFTRLRGAAAVRAVLGGLFVHDDGRAAADAALAFATGVAAVVPVVRLSVPDAPEAADWVRRAVEAEVRP